MTTERKRTLSGEAQTAAAKRPPSTKPFEESRSIKGSFLVRDTDGQALINARTVTTF
jgi:hypothetical protein